MKSRFIVVSNRLPISVTKVGDALQFNTSNGGLPTAMSSLAIPNQVWVGWPGIASDNLTVTEKVLITKELKKHNCVPVFLTAEQVAHFYEGYANDTLWPLFHYFPNYVQYRSDYWETYQTVNQLYARITRRFAATDATIWVHDYHLLLLPTLLRQRLPDSKIGFFLHIPFPSYEIFRLLPERKALIEGLMGADLLGFHIYDYARHFMTSCNRILGASTEQGVVEYQGRRVKIDVFPIGIDYKKFRNALRNPVTKQAIAKLDERYDHQRLILSIDRLDYSKGIMKRLEAYELLLGQYPELHGTVTLVMIAVPSRTEIATYKHLRDEIEQAVSHINGLYSTTDWTPISYQFQNLQFEQIVALYARAEIALVTPLRDGMNLVAKEYVASKRGMGVLILSEMAGAADELSEALMVNPNDSVSIKNAMKQALTMPHTEQQRRLRAMQKRIGSYTVQAWSADFMTQLEAAKRSHTGALERRLRQTNLDNLMKSYTASKTRLILLDYDGTLHGFSSSISPAAVRPGPKLRAQLKRISEQDNTAICIISGRPCATLDNWFKGIPKLLLVAEHGAWVKQKGKWIPRVTAFDKSSIVQLMQSYATRTPGSFIEEKDFAVVWHYRRVNPELAYIRNASLRHELRELVGGSSLSVHNGSKIIEVKPTSISKGIITTEFLETYPSDFIFAAGDDYTDESMFAALPASAYSIKVGFGDTKARYQVDKLEQILGIIDLMSKIDH